MCHYYHTVSVGGGAAALSARVSQRGKSFNRVHLDLQTLCRSLLALARNNLNHLIKVAFFIFSSIKICLKYNTTAVSENGIAFFIKLYMMQFI